MSLSFALQLILLGVVWLLALGWIWQTADWLLHASRVKNLGVDRHEAKRVGLVTVGRVRAGRVRAGQVAVIVPACNEQQSIAATLESLLKSKGVGLQVIAVNDRSTDRTGEIMDQLAMDQLAIRMKGQEALSPSQRSGGGVAGAEFGKAGDFQGGVEDGAPDGVGRHSLEILNIGLLPAGWLGKPHALAQGAVLAQSDWILFTDADIVFRPDAIALALDYAVSQDADHLVLLPDWITETVGELAMHGAMQVLSTWSFRPWRVCDPKRRDFIGVGAFNLIRRSVYESLGGFTALRMEVLEDLRMGWLIKRAGYRQVVAFGSEVVSVRWAVGARGVVRNLEKNLFALYRFNLAVAALACFGLLIQMLVPILALLAGGWARLGAIVVYGALAVFYMASRRLTRVSPVYVLAYPVAVGIFLWAHIRSVVLTVGRGGVVWRGTLYSLRELRANSGRFW